MTTEAVTDFYVTTIAFKRIVGNALSLLNAEAINLDVPYTDVSK